MNQDWNDPKSKLQQCCLTLRSMDGGEPDIPTYKYVFYMHIILKFWNIIELNSYYGINF